MEEQKTKKISVPVIVLIAVVLVAVIIAIIETVAGNKGLNAIVVRILRTEGKVNLYDEKGKEVSILENMRVADGNKVKTASAANVQMSLDEMKVVTLAEKSEMTFRKHGKELRLNISSGAIYVNVKEKLAEEETFEIETSTMMAGIRGTSLFIDSDQGELYVTDGVVSLTAKDPETGKYTAEEKEVKAGYKASITVAQDPKTGKMVTDFKVEKFSLEELPEAALKAIQGDTDLIRRIAKATGWEKDDLTAKVAVVAEGKIAEEKDALEPADGKSAENGEEVKAAAEKAEAKEEEERKAKLAAELEGAGTGEIITFGHYEQDNDLTNGAEPIDWVVLTKEEGKALVVSVYVLDCKKYNDERASVTWETCTLREWLNADFYNSAFNEIEKEQIMQIGLNGNNAVSDKVFLLSWEEAEKFFASDDARRCSPTAYAFEQGVRVWSVKGGGRMSLMEGDSINKCWWWLLLPRDPGDGGWNQSHGVDAKGKRDYYHVDYENRGVRPAMWISMD